MPSVQVALNGVSPFRITLDRPATRVVVTQVAGATPAIVYATANGADPVIPTSGVEITSGQRAIAADIGAHVILAPPLYTAPASGGASPAGMSIPSIRLLSAGTPTVQIEW